MCSRHCTYSDGNWDSEATVGVPNWGSDGGESGVSIGVRGFRTDVIAGYWGAVTAGVIGGLNAGLRRTHTLVFRRMES